MATKLYRSLLAMYPRDFRRIFAEEMAQVFGDRWRRAGERHGRLRMVVLLMREVLNTVVNAVAHRLGRADKPLGSTPQRRQNRKGSSVLENFFRDLHFTFRNLRKAPGFTAVVVGTLALGIGANTAIFSVVNVVLLTPPPFDAPENLVMVWERNFPRNNERNVVNSQNFTTWRERNDVFEDMAAWASRSGNLTGDGDPQRVRVSMVTTELFSLLRVNPMMGRVFAPEEIEPGNHRVVVLGYGFWQRQYGGDSEVIGTSITLNDLPHEIVGVMAAVALCSASAQGRVSPEAGTKGSDRPRTAWCRRGSRRRSQSM